LFLLQGPSLPSRGENEKDIKAAIAILQNALKQDNQNRSHTRRPTILETPMLTTAIKATPATPETPVTPATPTKLLKAPMLTTAIKATPATPETPVTPATPTKLVTLETLAPLPMLQQNWKWVAVGGGLLLPFAWWLWQRQRVKQWF
jgi:hypothetical protein